MVRDIQTIKNDISPLVGKWATRNSRFKDWYDLIKLSDTLKTTNMETGVTNYPRVMFELARYLMTAGSVRHVIPIEAETAPELEKQARVERGCLFLWDLIDHARLIKGQGTFLDELSFHILGLGWYAVAAGFDTNTLTPTATLWHPAQVYPRFDGGELTECLHQYAITQGVAISRAEKNGWNYKPKSSQMDARVHVDNYFFYEGDKLYNVVFIDGDAVSAIEERPKMRLLISPVGGFPDFGEIQGGGTEWTQYIGQSILEANRPIYEAMNKWLSFNLQILRDTAEHKWVENSAGPPKVMPEQLTKRNALFQFAPGESLTPLYPPPVPLELRAMLMDFSTMVQRGGFSDFLFGILQGQPSGALYSQAAETANRILYQQMRHKHAIVSEIDRFWLKTLKTSKKVLDIQGRMVEKLRPTDIPDNAFVNVFSEIATPRDWLERSTVANYLKDIVDETTLMDTILHLPDTEAVKRRKKEDLVSKHPIGQTVTLIRGMNKYAEYLEQRGDTEGASLFRQAAVALKASIGIQEQEGQGPEEVPRTASTVVPPTGGFGGLSAEQIGETMARRRQTMRGEESA